MTETSERWVPNWFQYLSITFFHSYFPKMYSQLFFMKLSRWQSTGSGLIGPICTHCLNFRTRFGHGHCRTESTWPQAECAWLFLGFLNQFLKKRCHALSAVWTTSLPHNHSIMIIFFLDYQNSLFLYWYLEFRVWGLGFRALHLMFKIYINCKSSLNWRVLGFGV